MTIRRYREHCEMCEITREQEAAERRDERERGDEPAQLKGTASGV